MKKFFKIVLLVVVIAAFLGTFVFLYRKSRPEEVTYQTLTAETRMLERTTVVTGTIEPRDEVLIKPQISGIISELYKEAGEQVKQGEVIAKVKVIPDMTALSSAENRVRLARINETQSRTDYERMKALYDDGLVSAEEFEQTRLAYDQAKEETVAAEDALQITKEGISRSNASYSTTLIRSTIDGLILDVPVKVGNSVIMSNTFLVFKGTIDETEVARIHEGMPVKITVGALQGQTFTATLEYIAPKVSSAATSANQFEIKAAVKIPAGVKIRAGYSANAEIVLERKERALSVPEGGIEYSGDSTFVYVLTGERPQTFARRQVVTGMSDGVNIEIARGLKAGDKVRGNKNEAQN